MNYIGLFVCEIMDTITHKTQNACILKQMYAT